MTYIPPRFAQTLAKQLTSSLELDTPLKRDDVIAASQAAWGGRFHRALARTFGRRDADAIMRSAAGWKPPAPGSAPAPGRR